MEHERIDYIRKEAHELGRKEERHLIIKHIEKRIGFWTDSDKINTALKRIKEEIENRIHHRIEEDTGDKKN